MADQKDNRLARELQTREQSQRTKAWQPPQLLPEPTPQEGWKFFWVRVSLMGTPDPMNLSAKMREGWEPVKAVDHPELQLQADPNSRFKDGIEIGGLLLCKAPVEMVNERNAYYAKQNQAQMDAVDNNLMKLNDNRMPLFNERRSEVSFGKGSK